MTGPSVFGAVSLGKNEPREDSRTLQAASYLATGHLPPIPARVAQAHAVPGFPMYLNDDLPDCTIAAAGHTEIVWATASGSPRPLPTEAEILAAFDATGPRDEGRVEIDVLSYWKHVGIGGRRIGAYVSLDLNRAALKTAIFLFGTVYLGLSLPVSAQRQRRWEPVGGPDSRPGSWGGHAVASFSYSPYGIGFPTWGRRVVASWRFVELYADEAYAVLSPDWLNDEGKSPQGFDMPALIMDLARL